MSLRRNRSLFQSLLFALLAVGLIAPAAHAATVVGDGTNATGILDFEFGGTQYNIEFIDADPGSPEVYGDPPVITFMTDTIVELVIEAVNVALEGSPAQTVGPEFGLQENEYWIAYRVEPGTPALLDISAGESFTDSTGTDWFQGEFQSSVPLDQSNDIYAVFSVVPEPGTALLMGLGLTGLAAGGRSRRHAAQKTA